MALSTFLRLKRLQWTGHAARAADTLIHKKVMGTGVGGKRFMGKNRGRWENFVTRDAVDLLQIRNWKSSARTSEDWRKVIGEVMA
jgi:hypothetical protein